MDIVVTIPKSEYKNDDLETEFLKVNGGYQFWSMNRIPKKLNEGDRVYFVRENKIESSMKIFNIEYNSKNTCEVTGRTWSRACTLCLCDMKEENLNIQVKGFQGFRYKWWEDEK